MKRADIPADVDQRVRIAARHRALDPVAGVIAQHFTAGGAHGRAAPFALHAGWVAAGLAAWAESIAFFEQVLASGVVEGR